MQRRPTLLNSCARAATAAEARFRITAAEPAPRASRVIALDEAAASLVRGLAGQHWGGGHFLVYAGELAADGRDGAADARLTTPDGSQVLLSEELAGADVAVMIATGQAGPQPAEVIGDACAQRRIASAGLVVTDGGRADAVVAALRPNAMVLVVLPDAGDIPGILSALRV
jgi:hypothetical protein